LEVRVEEGAVRKALCLLAAAVLLMGVLGVAQDAMSVQVEPDARLYLFQVPMDLGFTVMHLGLVFSEYVGFELTDIFAIGGGVATLVAEYPGGGYAFVDIVAPPGSMIVVNVPVESAAGFVGAYIFP
jgi:hypothetical protein